ncbi:hypothetical protein BgiMline_007034, partial [Biomphalaria glabrata]
MRNPVPARVNFFLIISSKSGALGNGPADAPALPSSKMITPEAVIVEYRVFSNYIHARRKLVK